MFAYFGSRGLYAYDFDGNLKWERDFGDMTIRYSFGEGSSPALHGDTLVLIWDDEKESFIVAVDKRTGKELWRKTARGADLVDDAADRRASAAARRSSPRPPARCAATTSRPAIWCGTSAA